MCVIIVKGTKNPMPTTETIERAMAANPHGFALVFAEGGKLHGLRTVNAAQMRKFYEDNFERFKNLPFVFHARLATHGSKSTRNCHGWLTDGGTRAFFHNGILSINSRGDMTDSETFLRDMYEPIKAQRGDVAAENLINAIIGGSKFAFINADGKIKTYGKFIERGGVWYSNLNFDYRRWEPDYEPGIYERFHRYAH